MGRMAVAIVNWNTRELLRGCLESVSREGPDDVVVIDNGSNDGSAEMVRREFPAVTLVVNSGNPGYGAASNAALSRCAAEYVLLLNADTVLRPGALAALSDYLDSHPRAALVGPRLRNLDGKLQRSCFAFPSPLVPFFKRQPLAGVVARVPQLQDRYVGAFAHDRARRIPWVLGAALALRRSAFMEVGGFDESFVMYFEEVDLCYRLRQAGWEIHFAPVTDVTHVGGASTRQRRSEMRVRLGLNSIEFYRRHRTGLPLVVALGLERTANAGRLLRDALRYHLSSAGVTRDRLAEDVAVWREVLAKSSRAARGFPQRS